MSTSLHLMTADDLLRLPDDGRRRELVRGELREMSPAKYRHGKFTWRLVSSLGRHVEDDRLGELFLADVGFYIARDPDTVRVPDVAFLSQAQLDAVGDPDGYWPKAPDMAVEVLSPSDRYSEVAEKVEDWLTAGCRMVIVVDPRRQSVEVHRPLKAVQRLTVDDVLDGDDVVPGWRLPVADIFDRQPSDESGGAA